MIAPLPPGLRRLGLIIIVPAIILAIFDAAARPSWHALWTGAVIAVVAALIGGISYRRTTTREQRRAMLRQLSPWAARHLPPSPDEPKDDDTTVSW